MAQGDAPMLVASVLPADFSELGHAVQEIEKAGVDRIQWDVMDGRFVPNLTFGADVIKACRPRVQMGFEAHLMVEDPDPLLDTWVDAGCELVIVHAETCKHLHRTLGRIHELGARAGVALNPATPLDAVTNVLDLTDLLLVMTVNPGFGGQAYIASMEPKIAAARAEIDSRGLDIELEVDGGIGPKTIGAAARAGARVFCAGSALFPKQGETMTDRAAALRAAATEAIA
ncbi:ribulose-phosphate 3-epimerase [Pseudonocardia phyllosphaerae]|uniref:ribulose-phosphate 3-epimerase n=1 Tax=Pseudonocardia phyllosphaerae TaxID=3390502 RepID=UPI00397BD9C0